MFCFAQEAYQSAAEELCKGLSLTKQAMELGHHTAHRFSNAELSIRIDQEVKDTPCLILGNVMPPEENLFEILLLSATLKEEGASLVTALLPYLSYTRQDKPAAGRSRAAPWLGALAAASGIDSVITVDLHNDSLIDEFGTRLLSLSPAPLWGKVLEEHDLKHACVVAPDEGARKRAEAVRISVGIEHPLVVFEKCRSDEGVYSNTDDEVRRKAIVVDDILDTGTTLVQACRGLRDKGVEEITVTVTHGLFTGGAWQKLWDLGVRSIYRTDSILPSRIASSERTPLISLIPLFLTYFGYSSSC